MRNSYNASNNENFFCPMNELSSLLLKKTTIERIIIGNENNGKSFCGMILLNNNKYPVK